MSSSARLRPRPADLLVIVGAGISVPEPTGAPDFRALRNHFLTLADPRIDPNRFELDELSPEQVFDAIDDGREELRAAVRRELWWLCEPNEPNPNHYAVAALLGSGAAVWTPNFDTMIERAAARLSIALQPVTPDEESDVDPAAPQLLKPHGSFPYTGDPPREPAAHDYRLLFQASQVWLLDGRWSVRLHEDVRDRDVFVFGYRGADPDLTPIMLRAFERARAVTWWELAGVPNLARLERLLSGTAHVTVEAGDPSAALQELAQRLAPHVPVPARGVAVARQRHVPPVDLSWVSRARLLEQFRGASVARRYLARAVVLDPRENRKPAFFRLVRSAGYDLRWVREPLRLLVGGCLTVPRLRETPRLAELYATLLDARPLRRGDRRLVKRALKAPGSQRPEILARVASTEKLLGELDDAVEHAESALREIERRPRPPRLEAMVIYNLAWTYRQRGEFERRARLVEQYADRMPHIGFNWAAWLGLDEVLVALHLGDANRARTLMSSPFLRYAHSLIAHPMYRLDAALTEALVFWHERGPAAAEPLLLEILARHPIRRFGHPPFSALDTLIVLADEARARGDLALMSHRLARARARTSSALQQAEIALVETTATGDPRALDRLRGQAAARRFGLVALTAEAVIAWLEGRSAPPPVITYEPHLPLAGTY